MVRVADQALSLNDIEHNILRPVFNDFRIHFAVNCASFGCPNLQSQAFTRDNVDALLESASREFLAHPRAIAFNADGLLQLSSIFDWYAEDFGKGPVSSAANNCRLLPATRWPVSWPVIRAKSPITTTGNSTH